MPSKRKTMRQKKRKKRGDEIEKAKTKGQDCSVTFKHKF